ncbi:MAG: hypothetical protein Q4B70_16375 [Lachnospiraceae bacterium]|nr:hypothetical protein [Lachnospiraceae bacterium]
MTLIKGGLFGIIFSTLYLIISSYLTTPWILGNFMMPLRYDRIAGEGLHISTGIVSGIGLLFAAGMSGYLIFRTCNFLPKDDQVG